MNEVKPLRCAIYTRKSVEDAYQKEQTSLESQRILCEKYASLHDWNVIPMHYEDYGYTGANMDRPGLQNLFADIRNGLIDCVLVYKMDRLSRSHYDIIRIVDGFFKEHNICFASASEAIDTATSDGILLMNVLGSFGQFEREQTRIRVKDKIRTSRKQGIWTGGHSPLGYKIVDHKLALDEETAPLVRSVFEDYIQGKSLREVARRLNTHRSENLSPFTYKQLLALIRNPICKGYIPDGGMLYPGRHEALVSEETWQQANDILHAKKVCCAPHKPSDALLKGIIRCEACDKSMIPNYAQKRSGQKHHYYTCLNKKTGQQCTGIDSNVKREVIEDLVLHEVRKILQDPSAFIGLREYLEHSTQNPDTAWEYTVCLGKAWDDLPQEQRTIWIRSLIKNVWIRKDSVRLQLTTASLKNILGNMVLSSKEILHEYVLPQKVAFSHQRKTPPPQSAEPVPTKVDPTPLNALRQAQAWRTALLSGKYNSMEDLAQHHQCSGRTIRLYISALRRLSPKVKAAILNNTFDPKYRIGDVIYKKIPEDWSEQEKMFGVT